MQGHDAYGIALAQYAHALATLVVARTLAAHLCEPGNGALGSPLSRFACGDEFTQMTQVGDDARAVGQLQQSAGAQCEQISDRAEQATRARELVPACEP